MSENLAADFAVLLRTRGWTVVKESTSGASLWALDHRAEMYLPSVVTRGSFEWSDVTERIASTHDEAVAAVSRDIDFVRFDITRFRVDNDVRDGQSIPLRAGVTVVGSAFGMLRAAATSARRPRQSIGSNYSKLGDEIAGGARLAHTEIGSFVFPVMLKVSEPEPEPETSFPGASFDSVVPESSERRVTRTLAQAIAAFDKHVLQPGKDPRPRDLTPVVIAGGTKEMFAHVNRAISEPGVSWLETGFTWAPIEMSGAEYPRKVRIPADAEARSLVARSVRLLSVPKDQPLRVVTGPIIHISHTPGEPLGYLAIQTPSPNGSRFGRVEVTVRKEQLTQIHYWMDQSTTVVVHGVVERFPGHPARLKGIASPEPLEDTLAAVDPK